MIGIDLGLQGVAPLKELLILWLQVLDDLLQRRPEVIDIHVRPGCNLLGDEGVEPLVDVQSTANYFFC